MREETKETIIEISFVIMFIAMIGIIPIADTIVIKERVERFCGEKELTDYEELGNYEYRVECDYKIEKGKVICQEETKCVKTDKWGKCKSSKSELRCKEIGE